MAQRRTTRGKRYFKNGITFEIALGYKCNLDCRYCYEKSINRNVKLDITDNIIKKTFEYIDYIKQYENFILLSFWGGEPLIYFNEMKKYFNRYENDKNIFFQFNTNTINIPTFIYSINDNIKKKLYLCLSYDFLPLNDLNRINNRTGKSSTDHVKSTLSILNNKKNEFKNIIVRSTCFNKDLEDHLYDSYLDFVDTQKKYPNCIPWYMLTPNFYHGDDICNLKKLENQLEKINKYLIDNKINDPKFNFYFTEREKNFKSSLCGFGRSNIFIDSDGNIYPCHGCSYRIEKDRYCLGNIESGITFDAVSKKIVNGIYVETRPPKCEKCRNTFCVFCFLQQNKDKNQSLPCLVMDNACSSEEYKFYSTISNAVVEYYKVVDTWK